MTDASDAIGDLRLGAVVINVQDMKRAVDFWTAVLGYERRDREWGPQFMMLVDPARQRHRAGRRPACRQQALASR